MFVLGVNAGEVNETETREIITESLKNAGWQLHKNMRYEYKITDGRVHIDEDDEPYREKALYADYLLFAPNGKPLAVVEAKREGQLEGTGIQLICCLLCGEGHDVYSSVPSLCHYIGILKAVCEDIRLHKAERVCRAGDPGYGEKRYYSGNGALLFPDADNRHNPGPGLGKRGSIPYRENQP